MKYKRLASFCLSILLMLPINLSIGVKAEDKPSKLAANSQVLVLQSDGRIFGWGDNSYGQLGIGNQKLFDGTLGSTHFAIYTPVEITFFRENNLTPVDVYCAQNTSYVVTSDGAMWAAGDNSKGQCGTGSTAPAYKSWNKVADTGTSTFKIGRVWCKYDVIFIENIINHDIYVFGSGENSKAGSDLQGNLKSPTPLGLYSTNLHDIQVSKTSTHFLFGSVANKTGVSLPKMMNTGVVTNVTSKNDSYSYFVSGYLGNVSGKPILTGSDVFLSDYNSVSTWNKFNVGIFNPLTTSSNIVTTLQAPLLSTRYYYNECDYEECGFSGSGDRFRSTYYETDFLKMYNPTSNSYYNTGYINPWVDKNNYSSYLTNNAVTRSYSSGYDHITLYFYPLNLNTYILTSGIQWTGDRLIYIKENIPYSYGNSNTKGQLGVTSASGVYTATVHSSLNSARASKGSTVTINKLVAFDEVNYMLLNDAQKTMFSNGSNEFGQLGVGKEPSELPFTSDAPEITALAGKGVISMQSDGYSVIALCGNGDIYTWGNNAKGTCGQGDDSASVPYFTTPMLLASFKFLEGAQPPAAPSNVTLPAFAHLGYTMDATWEVSADASKYLVEISADDGVTWNPVAYTTECKYTFDVGTKQTVKVRIAACNDYNLISSYAVSNSCIWKEAPAKPMSVMITPEYVPIGSTDLSLAWLAPGTGGKFVLQRKINEDDWTNLESTTNTQFSDTAQADWYAVKYRVAWMPDENVPEQSQWAESNQAYIGQLMRPVTSISAPASVNVLTPINLTWTEPDIKGKFYYKLYRKMNDDATYYLISDNNTDTAFSEDADQYWGTVQYKLIVSDGYTESAPVMTPPITVIGGTPPTSGGSGLSDEDLAAIIGIIGSGGNKVEDGLAVSTSRAITQLKSTVFGNNGAVVAGKFKTYEQLAAEGFEGYTDGLCLPVTYTATVLNQYVSGYLSFDGSQYPIHWGDFDGPTEVQNINSKITGYAYVPLADMTNDDVAVPCELFVQDSATSGGTPRVSFNELFSVGVDKENPTLSATANDTTKELTFDFSDGVSGIQRVVYRYKPADSTTWSAEIRAVTGPTTDTTKTVSFPRTGSYEISAFVYDYAGNKMDSSTGVVNFGGVAGGGGAGGTGIGEIETDPSGMLPDGISVYRENTPRSEIVIINGKEKSDTSFDRKTLQDLFS